LEKLQELSEERFTEVTADRGGESAALKRDLLAVGLECHVCPKSPAELNRRGGVISKQFTAPGTNRGADSDIEECISWRDSEGKRI